MPSDATPHTPLRGPARRDVVRGAAVGAVAATATVTPFALSSAHAAPTTGFLHGVASGDPLPTAVVLWTRVTPAAGRGAVPVQYVVARDAALTQVVRAGAPNLPFDSIFPFIGMFAVANSALINMLMASRLLYGLARQRVLPHALGLVHHRSRLARMDGNLPVCQDCA